jgi:hypothetical protein
MAWVWTVCALSDLLAGVCQRSGPEQVLKGPAALHVVRSCSSAAAAASAQPAVDGRGSRGEWSS